MAKGKETLNSARIVKLIKAQVELAKNPVPAVEKIDRRKKENKNKKPEVLQEQTPLNDELPYELILHTDNGVEFVSKVYYEFITQTKNLKGSTSAKGHPTDNAVVERFNKILKQQRLVNEDDGTSYAFPTSISTTQKLQTLIDKKVDYLNSSCHKYNRGLSPNQFKKKMLCNYIVKLRVYL
jgi:transposase InsO family protein